jgi:DNA-binding FrmR family transcriptional regulator
MNLARIAYLLWQLHGIHVSPGLSAAPKVSRGVRPRSDRRHALGRKAEWISSGDGRPPVDTERTPPGAALHATGDCFDAEDRSSEVESDKKQILNRLATIEGHLRAVQKMVEHDRCCRDILSQSYAVEQALKAFEAALVDRHLVSRLSADRGEERSSEMLREVF